MHKIFQKILDRFSTRLPQGMDELNAYCESLFATYDIPNLPSYHRAVATMIMHRGPTDAYIPKWYFVKSVYKAMSNEIAYNKVQALKEEEKAQQEAKTQQVLLDAEKPAVQETSSPVV